MYEGLVCVCCLASDEEQLLDLFPSEQGGEDYSRLLLDCFQIEVSGREGHGHVCAGCAGRLQDVAEFKRQISTALALLSSQCDTYRISPRKKSKSLQVKKNKHCLKLRLISKKEPKSITEDDVKQRHHRKVPQKKPIYVVPEGVRLRKSHVRPTADKNPIMLNERNIYPAYKLGPSDLACRECPLVFTNSHGLQSHMNEHFQNYGCRHCTKAFMTMDSWKRHQRTHNKGAFPCKHCDRVFSNLNTCMSHTRYRHSALPSHLCRECGARFHTYHQRAKHMRDEHALPGQYACPNCAQTFVAYRSRRRHMQLGRCPMLPSLTEKEIEGREATENIDGADFDEIHTHAITPDNILSIEQIGKDKTQTMDLESDISQAEYLDDDISQETDIEGRDATESSDGADYDEIQTTRAPTSENISSSEQIEKEKTQSMDLERDISQAEYLEDDI